MLTTSKQVSDGDLVELDPEAEVSLSVEQQGRVVTAYVHAVSPGGETQTYRCEIVECWDTNQIEAEEEPAFSDLVHVKGLKFYRVALVEVDDA